MYMVIYALRLPEINIEDFPASMHRDFYHILIHFLLHEIDAITKRGLLKGYTAKADNLPYIRGKVLFKEHLLYNQNRNNRIYCKFPEITSDTLENRILKFTLFHLSQHYFIDIKTMTEIIDFYRAFGKVTSLHSMDLSVLKSVNFTPLNEHYRVALDLCELMLRDSSLNTETKGEKNSLSFLINMDTLFQNFIANLLETEFSEVNMDLQKTGHLDLDKRIRITPDIKLSLNNETVLILDTKYKEMHDNGIPPSDHVMQVQAYSISSKAKRCGLIYASNKNIKKRKYPLVADIDLYTIHFNLASSSKEEFYLNCNDFINEIRHILR